MKLICSSAADASNVEITKSTGDIRVKPFIRFFFENTLFDERRMPNPSNRKHNFLRNIFDGAL